MMPRPYFRPFKSEILEWKSSISIFKYPPDNSNVHPRLETIQKGKEMEEELDEKGQPM